jgi:DNA-binding transcriptional ArsR family regulator
VALDARDLHRSLDGSNGRRQFDTRRYFDKIRIMEPFDAVRALAALAQPTRLEVFRLLVQAGPDGLTVGRINESLETAPATLSFHLKELANAGLIDSRQEGRFVRCSASFERMNDLLAFLTENCCQASGASCAAPLCQPAQPERPPARRSRRPHEKVSRPSRRR